MKCHNNKLSWRTIEALEARLLLTAEATPLLTASLTAEARTWPVEEPTIADFNGDGRKDRISGNSTSVEIRYGNDAGVFGDADRIIDLSEIVELNRPGNAFVAQIASEDLNDDGLTDFVAAIDDEESTRFVAMVSNGEGGFEKRQEWTLRVFLPYFRKTKLVDVDGNGQLDLVASSAQGDDLEWLMATSTVAKSPLRTS